MLTKNVYYSTPPDKVVVYSEGDKALIEFPINVTETRREDESGVITEYLADAVYSISIKNGDNLKDRVLANYDEWLEFAKKPETQKVELSDLVEALNTLTELILGGDI